MPLVLTTNEIVLNPDHAWNDIEGVQYHYPNQYKNKVKTGESFVYYRGVHRKDGRRGQAEYFGRGTIGEIRIDPETIGQSRPSWFCGIENYRPFTPPISAKVNGEFYEKIAQNMWRNGVRDLAAEVYENILTAAGAPAPNEPATATPVGIREGDNLAIPRSKLVAGSRGGAVWRKSKRSKEVGDWAEQKAIEFVRDTLGGVDIAHRAAVGETPGWDFDYRDPSGALHRVEVKGTVSGAFSSFDLTVGEYQAAKAHCDSYWLFLVANCLTDRAKVQRIRNPASLIGSGGWTARPILFNVSFG